MCIPYISHRDRLVWRDACVFALVVIDSNNGITESDKCMKAWNEKHDEHSTTEVKMKNFVRCEDWCEISLHPFELLRNYGIIESMRRMCVRFVCVCVCAGIKVGKHFIGVTFIVFQNHNKSYNSHYHSSISLFPQINVSHTWNMICT